MKNDQLLEQYAIRGSVNHISYFLATEDYAVGNILQIRKNDNLVNTWKKYCKISAAKHTISGNHFTILKPPHVQKLAKAINKEISKSLNLKLVKPYENDVLINNN